MYSSFITDLCSCYFNKTYFGIYLQVQGLHFSFFFSLRNKAEVAYN